MKKNILILFILVPFLSNEQNVPTSCTGTLKAFDSVRQGSITSEVIIAKDYYLDPRNNIGDLTRRRAKLDSVTRKVFLSFINTRKKEYEAIKCHYKGVDWNQAGNSSWRTLTCQPGFAFVESSLVRTQNGDWKRGPFWGPNFSTIRWKTGWYRRSETHVDIDAVYFEIDKKVIDELNIARKSLFDLGIPTELP